MEKNNTIDKFKEFERFGSRLGLERMSKIMELLGNPQEDLKYIHVAGTNGKGSVCKYIYEALQENGYKVGLFISPFLEIFNERIEFNREYISDEDLKKCTDLVLEKVDTMLAEGFESPTEFEVITAVAFVYFHMKQADFVVLEVGLGGRGDSTNIIKNPLACVITSISYDHMDRLGNTLEEIAAEKAGIIKAGVPVITNVEDRGAARVIAKKAYEENSVLHDVQKIKYAITEKSLESYKISTNIYGTDYSEVELGMVGDHQVKNALTALTTLELLRKSESIKIERSRLYKGIKLAKQIGRFELMNPKAVKEQNEPYIIIDGAHNEDSAAALVKTVETLFEGKKTLMIVGMLGDKNTSKILDSFVSISHNFVATEPDNPRKWPAEELKKAIESRNKACTICKTPEEACEFALRHKGEYETIIFAGSLYLIGKVRGILKTEVC